MDDIKIIALLSFLTAITQLNRELIALYRELKKGKKSDNKGGE